MQQQQFQQFITYLISKSGNSSKVSGESQFIGDNKIWEETSFSQVDTWWNGERSRIMSQWLLGGALGFKVVDDRLTTDNKTYEQRDLVKVELEYHAQRSRIGLDKLKDEARMKIGKRN